MKTALLLYCLPSLIMIGAMAGVLYPVLWIDRFKKRGRRSPLANQLLRSPGESLRIKIEDLNSDITAYLSGTVSVPLLIYSSFLTGTLINAGEITNSNIFIYSLGGVIIIGFLIFKLSRLMSSRNRYRLGWDAEMAVGQELNQLMLNHCRVFHDFVEEDKFNIDHIVVGPGGVYAVETKGRAKPDKKRGSVDATVTYDGKSLRFPDWSETAPLDQARRQAKWLGTWLTSAVGEPVAVQPALALPGWYVKRISPGGVTVFSGKNPKFLARAQGEGLSDKMVERIAHQLEQRCRDVEPAAYKKEKK